MEDFEELKVSVEEIAAETARELSLEVGPEAVTELF